MAIRLAVMAILTGIMVIHIHSTVPLGILMDILEITLMDQEKDRTTTIGVFDRMLFRSMRLLICSIYGIV